MDQEGKSISHATARRVLRRAGFAPADIEELSKELPDPINVDRDRQVLDSYGVTREYLTDALGGSP